MDRRLVEIEARIDAALSGTGLFRRGAFNPAANDGAPALPDGRAAGTILVIGNAGPALWRAFVRDDPVRAGADPLDRWVEAALERAAAAAGGHALSAMKKPWPPIQRWAMRAENVHLSPIGLVIHGEFGLWGVYRGAILLAERFAVPPVTRGAAPCDSCAAKPCLTACPAGAFTPGTFPASFDSVACVDHVAGPAGGACAGGGCLARRACPVGRAHAYDRDAAAYHMAAVVKAVRGTRKRGENAPGP
jgi:hypothetical protein